MGKCCRCNCGINPAPGVTMEEELTRIRLQKEHQERKDAETVSEDWDEQDWGW